jgi:hypothetical protein
MKLFELGHFKHLSVYVPHFCCRGIVRLKQRLQGCGRHSSERSLSGGHLDQTHKSVYYALRTGRFGCTAGVLEDTFYSRNVFRSGAVVCHARLICRREELFQDGRFMYTRFNDNRVYAERAEFEAVGIGQRLQGKLARAVHCRARKHNAACARAHMDQQSTSLPAHCGQYRTIDANDAINIHIEYVLELLDGVRFRHAHRANPGVIYNYVNTPGLPKDLLNGLGYRNILRNVQIQHMKASVLAFRQRLQSLAMR